jgi:hypothetical protein
MNQTRNQTARREAKQIAQYERNVVLHRLLNEPIEPFQYKAARPKKLAPPVRTIPKQANRFNIRRTGPSRDLTNTGVKDGGDRISSVASAYSRGFSSQKPQFNVTNDGIRIRKRELLASITGSSGFAIALQYSLNPGLFASFPWLASQAAGWEQYKFHKLKYIYYTRTGTSTPGSMILVPDYDAADPAPTNEIQAMDYKDAKEEAPWVVEFCCDLNPAAMHQAGGRKFIRNVAVANTDIKTYDVGNMYAITTDGTAVNWGKLFVEYDVEFFVSQQAVANPNVAVGVSAASSTTSALAGMVYTNSPGGLALSGTANTLTMTGLTPGQEYLITWATPLANSSTITFSTLTGGTLQTNWSGTGSTGSGAYTFLATAAGVGTATLVFSESNSNATTALVSISSIPNYAH